MTSSILIDKNTIQIFAHFEEHYFNPYGHRISNSSLNNRLKRFFEILRSIKVKNEKEITIVIDEITEKNLSKADCLIILTRIKPFSHKETKIIMNFILDKNKKLLFMSNHDPDQAFDNEFTEKIGVIFTGGYYSGTRGEYTTIGEKWLTTHKILTGTEDQKAINSLMTNTTCRIESKIGVPFIFLPDSMIGGWGSTNETPIKNRVFGLIINDEEEKNVNFKAKAIFLADSGFIGDRGSEFPGYGLVHQLDNELLLQRILTNLLN